MVGSIIPSVISPNPDSESGVVAREKAADRVLEENLELHRRLNLTPSMLSVIEPDGRYAWVNDVALQYFGLSAADLASDDLRRRVVHPDEFQKLREERERFLANGVPFEYENRLRRNDGQYRWFLVRYQPLKDAAGRVVRWYGGAIDIEDRKRAEEARLEERVRERTRIARELHDTLLQRFQALLLHFHAATKSLQEHPAEARMMLERTLDQAEQAIAEGRDAIHELRSAVAVNDLAVAIRTLGAELAADEANRSAAVLDVAVVGTPREVHPVLCDEAYRIVSEALRNAFWHARAQQIDVEIRYGEEQFGVRVRDDGKGIDPKFLGRDGREGHYGLQGMRERAELAGGQLTISSELVSGTEIALSIPASIAYVSPRRLHDRTASA